MKSFLRIILLPQSYEKAAEYYQLATDQDDAVAMYNLGILYKRGKGVNKSEEKAFEYVYKVATSRPFGAAHFELGRMYAKGIGTEKSPTDAKKWLESAIKLGNKQGKKALHAIGVLTQILDFYPNL